MNNRAENNLKKQEIGEVCPCTSIIKNGYKVGAQMLWRTSARDVQGIKVINAIIHSHCLPNTLLQFSCKIHHTFVIISGRCRYSRVLGNIFVGFGDSMMGYAFENDM